MIIFLKSRSAEDDPSFVCGRKEVMDGCTTCRVGQATLLLGNKITGSSFQQLTLQI